MGAYYQTKQAFTFDNAVLLANETIRRDVDLDLPQNLGFGIANRTLMDGRLLVGVEVLYKLWNEADLFAALYDNQWVIQVGGQYTAAGIGCGLIPWAENPLDSTPDVNAGASSWIRCPRCLTRKGCWRSPARTASRRVSGSSMSCPASTWIFTPVACSATRSRSATSRRRPSSSYWVGAGLTWRFGRGLPSCLGAGQLAIVATGVALKTDCESVLPRE